MKPIQKLEIILLVLSLLLKLFVEYALVFACFTFSLMLHKTVQPIVIIPAKKKVKLF